MPGARAAVTVAAFLGVATLHLVAQLWAGPVLRDWTQALVMPALIPLVLSICPRGRTRTGVLVAVAASWVGDVAPKLVPQQASFVTMVAAFALAQLTYVWVFRPWVDTALRTPRLRPMLGAAALSYLLVATVLGLALVPRAGVVAPAVLVYAVVIATMAVCAVPVHPITATGAAVFVLSDALIGLQAFYPPYQLPGQGFWVMLTYISAQGLIVWGLARRLARDPRPAPH